MTRVKARVEQVWIQSSQDAGREVYQVIIRIDTRKGKFIEGVYRHHDEALSRLRALRRSFATVDEDSLRPTT